MIRERSTASTKAGKELLAKDEEITRLRKESKQLRQRLEQAEAVIEIQKKVCTLFDISSETEAGKQSRRWWRYRVRSWAQRLPAGMWDFRTPVTTDVSPQERPQAIRCHANRDSCCA